VFAEQVISSDTPDTVNILKLVNVVVSICFSCLHQNAQRILNFNLAKYLFKADNRPAFFVVVHEAEVGRKYL